MPGTLRAISDLDTLLASNTTGNIGAQDVLDFLYSTARRFTTGDITGGGQTHNFNNGNVAVLTLTGNVTGFSITNGVQGHTLSLALKQDGAGSRTLSGVTGILWESGSAPTLTTTAGRMDVFTFTYDGTNWYESALAVMDVG